MNVLVTGANGQLGNEMRLVARDSSDKYVFTDVNQVEGLQTEYLDITDMESVRRTVKDNDIDVIVNCAAYTNVDAAESNAELAMKLNAEAPSILARVMAETGGLLVHISTDYVFGKEPYNIPCREDQKGTPTGVYGHTKLCGEEKIIASGCKYVIIRTAWLYSEFGRNFCKTMLSLTATKPQINVVFDQCGTPTYALDLARTIDVIIADFAANGGKHTGIYHYSNEGVCSWFDFTKMIQKTACDLGYYDSLEQCPFGPSCIVRPCHSNEFPSPVIRPSYSVLDKTRIKETFGLKIPYWTDSLERCIAGIMAQ